ncbi:MAG: isochorismatase family protein [Sulfuritalea sp.]|nr:isochorismatase family protein [Sulfuritalea sp.]
MLLRMLDPVESLELAHEYGTIDCRHSERLFSRRRHGTDGQRGGRGPGREAETIIRKNFPNSFRDTPLLEHLRDNKITRLVIAGMMTQMCIDSTVRAAADLGFECSLAHDACATKSLSFGGMAVPADGVQAAFLAALNGLFAKVQSVDDLCAGI